MSVLGKECHDSQLPRWVPDAAKNYLVHTEGGKSIRALARVGDCHPSTVMRQVRRLEGRRDDPLVDAALDALSELVSRKSQTPKSAEPAGLTQSRIEQEAKRVLRRLCEQGAVLAVARDMESAVVVRQTEDGEQLRTAVVARDIAQALALKDWMTCTDPNARVARYVITNAGRAELRRLTAQDENRASGLSEVDSGVSAWDDKLIDLPRHASRPQPVESPLVGLSRRRDSKGHPLLSRDLVAVGERLREDYELVELAFAEQTNWRKYLEGDELHLTAGGPKGGRDALDRIRRALAELGPGLSDVALRCCCFLEGLEQTEKTMGWSARSGKIVLRIALQRLKRHYAETEGRYGPMIG